MTARDTVLAERHVALGARMGPFAGWRMPLHYGSILDEAAHVRRAAGLFDLCHMGRLRIHGRDGAAAAAWLDGLVTCDVRSLRVGRIRYALLTRPDGTTIDDVLVYREPDSIFLCVNASNLARDRAWLETHAAGTDVRVEDLSESHAMLAVQGPRAIDVVRPLLSKDPGAIGYYGFTETTLCDLERTLVSRTGYTGEDGFELVFPMGDADRVFSQLFEAGGPHDLRPIGLAARDTLRLEAGMPLYGHEIDDETTPVEAGLMFAVKRSFAFLGGETIRDLEARGTKRRLVGFTVEGPRLPRQGTPILDGDEVVGEVRSGTRSPVLGVGIGTGYVDSARSSTGTRLAIDLRTSRAPVELRELPFYRRARA